MDEKEKPIILFDMDGTLCDFVGAISKDMEKLRYPKEPKYHHSYSDDVPGYIKARERFIKSSQEWWENLPKFKLGWDILKMAKNMGFRIVILTKASRESPDSYAGKKAWIEKNLGGNTEINFSEDKSLVYGRMLVDDSTKFADSWLKHHPRGWVIMPADHNNKDFKHERIVRYTGRNLSQVRKILVWAKNRKSGSD